MIPLFLYSYSNYNNKPPTIPKTFNKYEEIGDIQNYKKYNMNDLDQQEEDVNKKGDNIFHQMLIDISDLTRSITNKGLQKLDKINNFSDTVIDEGNETLTNTSQSLNTIISNISSITNIFKSENFYYFIIVIFVIIIIIKKI
ncbi:hypothetical protein ABPG72_005876 [Tetrahymena utriculariae]